MKQPTKKDEERAADRVSKPPGHGRRMSSRQILDIHEGRAHMKPIHHQPVPSEYGTWWGHGSEVRGYDLVVGRGDDTYFGFLPKLFREVCLVGMTDYPKEVRLREEPLGAWHEGWREKTPTSSQERAPWQANK